MITCLGCTVWHLDVPEMLKNLNIVILLLYRSIFTVKYTNFIFMHDETKFIITNFENLVRFLLKIVNFVFRPKRPIRHIVHFSSKTNSLGP